MWITVVENIGGRMPGFPDPGPCCASIRGMNVDLRITAHSELSLRDLERLRTLFDHEYFGEYGPWDPEAPYGYSPAAVHIMAFQGEELIGHLGFQPRSIKVGGQRVTVAGVGGVLIVERARGRGLGQLIMDHARAAMLKEPGVEYGYLGCRPAVVPFYESTGWQRIHALERHLSRLDPTTVIESAASPIFICPIRRGVDEWPQGEIDLRGTPW